MKPFVFRARAALHLRRRQAEQALQALAGVQLSVQDAEAALASARDAHRAAGRAAGEAEQRSGTAGLLQWHRNWILARHRDVTRCETELSTLREQERIARHEALQARMRVRVLEKLRERARRTYLAEETRAEQRMLDALGTVRHVVRDKGGSS